MTTNQALVSIGMPVFNGERFIKQALDSLIAQTFADFELIISDNGSTDGTEAICRAYANKDGRIRYHRNARNIGGAPNHNRVLKRAKGKYFRWAHHDDVCAPEYLARCVEILERRLTVVLCYPKTTMIDECGNFVRDVEDGLHLPETSPIDRYKSFHRRFRRNWQCNPFTGLMRTEALKKTRQHLSIYAADIVFLSELVLLGIFYEVPGRLFFRCTYPEVSNLQKPEAMAIYENPLNQARILFPRFRLVFELAKGIRCSQLNWYQKLRCYPQVGLWILRFPKGLVQDLLSAGKQIARQSLRKVVGPIVKT